MSAEKKANKFLKVDRATRSNLSSFVERPVPTPKEVASFERVVNREARGQEIDSNLSEVYSDKKGGRVDVRKMRVKKQPIFLVRFFKRLLAIFVIAFVAYLIYFFWSNHSSDVSALEFKITPPDKVAVGEEFSYQIEYHNPTQYVLSDLNLELKYPAGFIFSAASIAPESGNYGWNLPDLAPGGSANLTVTGQLFNQPDSVNIISGRLSYLPGSFTSQFKKEASASTLVSGPGFRIDLDYSQNAFLNQDNEMVLIFSDIQSNQVGDFNISFGLPAETSAWVATTTATTTEKKITITKNGGTSWQVGGLTPELSRQEVSLFYHVNQKINNLEVKVRLEKKMPDGQSYVFWEKAFQPQLVTSDLNLTLILNGSKNDGAINFGQTLDYSLVYANRGTDAYRDVAIMASLTGDFLDWSSLVSDPSGEVRNQTIIWTKNELSELAEIKPGQEGQINFSLNLSPFSENDLGSSLGVVSYGQYSMNNKSVKGEENKSNIINSQINSDLSLSEEIRYFNDDNIPVGSGPLPPKVGQKTSVRVYWTVKNNLHELNEVRAVFALPAYVNFDERTTTNVGNLYYDNTSRQVIWEIGRLPVSVYRADAEFSISVTPAESDHDRILILSPGSTISAMDVDTKGTITKKTSPKTTRLEDDDIAGLNNSGRVE